jgi:hypothetical protein
MKPTGEEEMLDWVANECIQNDVEGSYRVEGRDGNDGVTGSMKVDVLVRRSAGFDVRKSLRAKMRSAVNTTKRKTVLKLMASSIRGGVAKVLYNGDPGKSVAAQCSVSSEIEASSQMIGRAVMRVNNQLKMLTDKVDHNHALYQKSFRDIEKSVVSLETSQNKMFRELDKKITDMNATSKVELGRITSTISTSASKHDESIDAITIAVRESAEDLKKTVHATGQDVEEKTQRSVPLSQNSVRVHAYAMVIKS